MRLLETGSEVKENLFRANGSATVDPQKKDAGTIRDRPGAHQQNQESLKDLSDPAFAGGPGQFGFGGLIGWALAAGSADDEFAAHEILVVENAHGTLGFLE